MDTGQAEENIKVIREIMERSTKYTNFSGLSGIFAGLLALAGCAASILVAYSCLWWSGAVWHVLIWVSVFLAAIAQDAFFANRKAKRNGERLLNPASIQVIKAVTPGVLAALILSIRALQMGEWNSIPAIWTIGYGVADCAAGMFSVPEVRIFGIVQLITGSIGLFLCSALPSGIWLMALSFGVYHILFGFWLSRKYGW